MKMGSQLCGESIQGGTANAREKELDVFERYEDGFSGWSVLS